MRISSPLIFDLARSSEVAELAVEEQRILIPPVINPTIRLQAALTNVPPVFTDPVRASFVREFQTFQSGIAVGSSTTVVIFDEGLWDVWASFTHITDLAEAIDTDPRAGLQLIDPAGGTARLLTALAGTHQTAREGRWRFLFPREGNWLLTHFVEATVAAQERYALSAIAGNRLL